MWGRVYECGEGECGEGVRRGRMWGRVSVY